MIERPLLMSGPMVRATLANEKTQTRRVVKVPAYATLDGSPNELREDDGRRMGDGLMVRRRDGEGFYLAGSPYGWIGDRLWVRETWARPFQRPGSSDRPFAYRADLAEGQEFLGVSRWRPSIHMPRAASRITLEITDVRVERLQAITAEDIAAEGLWHASAEYRSECCVWRDSAVVLARIRRDYFARLWDGLNAKRGYGWDANPWVWVIGFRRVES